MQQGDDSGLKKEPWNQNYYPGQYSTLNFEKSIFFDYQGKWRGYPKDYPDYQAYGASFEELQLKLHQLRRGLSRSTSSSVCSNAALFGWYWQRRMSPIHY